MIVKVVSQENIKPSNPTPQNLRYLQPSLFDQINSPILMPFIFFYSPKKSSTNLVFNQVKKSLSKTLSVFYPLAGRYQDRPNTVVICNDDGVPYMQAEANSRIEDIVHRANQTELDKLLPSCPDEMCNTLILSIQVNSFLCGGFAIGVKMSHAVADAFSILMFVKTWAEITNDNVDGDHTLIPRPFFKVSKMFPQNPFVVKKNTFISSKLVPRPITKRFLFTKASIDSIRSTISRSDDIGNLSSTTMILSAFIWSRIKDACLKDSNDIPYEINQAINLRPVVNQTLNIDPNLYLFGNMWVNAISMPKIETNPANFLKLMQDSIRKVRCVSYVQDLVEGRSDLNFVREHFNRKNKGEIVSIGFSSFRSLPVYEPDFGFGTPVWVALGTVLYENLIQFVPAGPSSDDTFAFVSLMAEDMKKLKGDQLFNSFVSSKTSYVNSKM